MRIEHPIGQSQQRKRSYFNRPTLALAAAFAVASAVANVCAAAPGMAAAQATADQTVAQAQYSRNGSSGMAIGGLQITSFTVEPVQRLAPGEVLVFQVQTMADAAVSVRIDGAANDVRFDQTQPGTYVGSYTIRRTDRVQANSRITAQAARNGQTATASLMQSIVAGGGDWSTDRAGDTSRNAIARFEVDAPNRIRPGDELKFTVAGAAGGQAYVNIEGTSTQVPLREVNRGVYEGSYIVKRGDRLPRSVSATAYLVNDGRNSMRQYVRNVGSDQRSAQQDCINCGTVESVKRVEVKGSDPNNVLGTIAGGVLGGVLGNQVGGGSGKDLARVIGAVGGAYAGNRAQNNRQAGDAEAIYRVTVRLSDGNTRDFDYPNDPEVQVGTRVKIEDGVLMRR